MISVKNLSHSYNEDGNFAVKNISFEVANDTGHFNRFVKTTGRRSFGCRL